MHIYSNLNIISFLENGPRYQTDVFPRWGTKQGKMEKQITGPQERKPLGPGGQEAFLSPRRCEIGQRVWGIEVGRAKSRSREKAKRKDAGGARECPSKEQPSQKVRTQGGVPREGRCPTFHNSPCTHCNFIPTPIHCPQLPRGRSNLGPS